MALTEATESRTGTPSTGREILMHATALDLPVVFATDGVAAGYAHIYAPELCQSAPLHLRWLGR